MVSISRVPSATRNSYFVKRILEIWTYRHNFDSVKAINDHDEDPSQSEIDAEEIDSTDEELIEENDLLEEETETPNNRPITLELFRNNTIWFNYNPQAHSESMCTICQELQYYFKNISGVYALLPWRLYSTMVNIP